MLLNDSCHLMIETLLSSETSVLTKATLSDIKCWETIEWLHILWPLDWNSAPQS
jgi:hypothetical protein